MNDFLSNYGDTLVILVLLAIIIWQVSIDIRWDKYITKINEEEKLKEGK